MICGNLHASGMDDFVALNMLTFSCMLFDVISSLLFLDARCNNNFMNVMALENEMYTNLSSAYWCHFSSRYVPHL